MKFPQLFIFLFLLNVSVAFSQKVIKHTVKSGESIYSIAKKYDVTEKEVLELNPKLKGTILGLKTVVQIPNKKYKPSENKDKFQKKEVLEQLVSNENESVILHLVSAKETLYSISKNYGVSMEEICELNPELKVGKLQTGSRIKLPNPQKTTNSDKESKRKKNKVSDIVEPTEVEVITSNVDIVHKVLPKETLYGISKQFGVTIDDLKRNNPQIKSGLKVGYVLVIKNGSPEIVPEKEGVAVKDSIQIAEQMSEEGTDDIQPLSDTNLSKADFLIGKASENIGTRYRSGGTTTAGFDCSGLMCYTFNNIDLKLPRSSYQMAGYGTKIKKSKAQKGDLIFFATFGRGRISHVGMVTEVLDDEIKFIHSSISAGVIISSTKENYYSKSFVQINRILKN